MRLLLANGKSIAIESATQKISVDKLSTDLYIRSDDANIADVRDLHLSLEANLSEEMTIVADDGATRDTFTASELVDVTKRITEQGTYYDIRLKL